MLEFTAYFETVRKGRKKLVKIETAQLITNHTQ